LPYTNTHSYIHQMVLNVLLKLESWNARDVV